nr:transposase [Dyadobacter frigoris]
MDSNTINVCKNQRIHNHKVFKNLAERGKFSTGWTGRPRSLVLSSI